MLAGMYAHHGATVVQVLAITQAPAGYGVDAGPATYLLSPIDGTDAYYAREPALHLTAACSTCQRPAGHGTCHATGEHQGPLPVRQPPPARDYPRGCCPSPDHARAALCGCGGRPEPAHL